jgi:hypothetical protein
LPDWIRANTINQRVPQDGYSYINNITTDQTIPNNTYTKIGALVNDFVLSTLPITRAIQTAIIPRT